jgi:ketosteroid isomerase-like protein
MSPGRSSWSRTTATSAPRWGRSRTETRSGGFLGAFDSAFPGARYEITQVFETGTSVAVEGVYRGIHSGPLITPDGAILPASGQEVAAPFVTVFEVADGSIRSHRPYWDLAGFMAQLTG